MLYGLGSAKGIFPKLPTTKGYIMTINDRVKVKDQDITGIIVEDYGNIVIIKDDDAEMWVDEFDDGTLEFRKSELTLLESTPC